MKISAIVLALFLEVSNASLKQSDSTNIEISVDVTDENTSIASLAKQK